ncbi:DUF6932 family protein [Pseudomonas petrae]|uniref:DUF6932 family protein n=1 Tax=Pseudomonas petrae TaxID=2912190 RepID=UPI001F175972|nr:hypothetical protein [Pseudomonas petrae]MCF7536188.1 hypothetical protein [Pseudomonas petrae]
MTQEKLDYPPLLSEGIHSFTLESLRLLTVENFPNSMRRPALFGALGIYLELLQAAGYKGFAWIDGSFMCEKLEPEDIDIVLVYEAAAIDGLSDSVRPVLNNLFDTVTIKNRFKLHVFPVPAEDQDGVMFWKQKFGTQRDETTPKGLASLGVNL